MPVLEPDARATGRNWNLPNVITAARILLAPISIAMLLVDAGRDGWLRWAGAAVFILAMATDGIDGAIARKWHMVTDLGKILDPVADKVITGGALISLSILGELPWFVTLLILVREVGITVWRLAHVRRGRVVPASAGGKAKTILLTVAISLALVPTWVVFGTWIFWINGIVMTVAVIVTVMTGIDYLWRDRRLGARQ